MQQVMPQKTKLRRRLTDTLEEVVNVATHGAGLLASVVLLPVLVLSASRASDTAVTIGVLVFALTLIGAYAASTMYHSRRPGPNRDLWRRLDQSAVYLLIAGTYTPFALGALRGPLGFTLLAVVWTAAIVGIAMKVGRRVEAPTAETITYLAMGWLVMLAAKPLIASIGWAGIAWIAAGGVAYTVGVIFLVNQKRLRYGHCIWHLMVLGGSACHAIAVVNYGLRLP